MAEVKWTGEQRKVIELRDRNLLVSAAAGSGKTAVLVERIIARIIKGERPLDIDRLLVVTFTKAAAAEMRERIGEAIEQRLLADSSDDHLQRQQSLLHNAQITTIDSFCMYVVRNYFHLIDLDPAFRVGEEAELTLLRSDVIGDILEKHYSLAEPEFLDFVECYTPGKSDRILEELIGNLYDFSRSYPWPEEWLKEQQAAFVVKDMADLEQKTWMKKILDCVNATARDLKRRCEEAEAICLKESGPAHYLPAVKSDRELLESLGGLSSYEEGYRALAHPSFARLSAKRAPDADERKKEAVKAIRDEIKKGIGDLSRDFFFQVPEEMMKDMNRAAGAVKVLTELTLEFAEEFAARKEEKNLLDFGDLEHCALRILVKKENGQILPTEAAGELAARFDEIMIDEYQDSNLVQEVILNSVSREREGKPNVFMVGDVKQSIYKFRLARPELFLEKYLTYSTQDGNYQRIDLHKNFRSREIVLHSANLIFGQIMTKALGGIVYDKSAALYPGAEFAPCEEAAGTTDVLLLDGAKEDTGDEEGGALYDAQDQADLKELEARMIAGRIRELTGDQGLMIWDKEKKEYRRARYKDIVILLRTMSGWSELFVDTLSSLGIPAYADTQTGYFQTVEIRTMLNLLRILDNPRQDIPLAAVLYSPIAGFTSRELADMKCGTVSDKPLTLYETLCRYSESGGGAAKKAARFLEMLVEWRKKVPMLPVHELIELLYEETGYYDYVSVMPSGEKRERNMDMLITQAVQFEKAGYHGLFHFVRYVEKLLEYDVDYGEAQTAGENDNTVRIMSIHKSKGLEFPIVIAAGLGKMFNHSDARAKVVLHSELGIGPDSIDPKLRVKAPTLLKKVIQREIRNETLSEELRVLYVALTRAKEKLILSGAVKNLEKQAVKWLGIAGQREKEFLLQRLTAGSSFLDYIVPALVRHPDGREFFGADGVILQDDTWSGARFAIRTYRAPELAMTEVKRQKGNLEKKAWLLSQASVVHNREIREELERAAGYSYPYEAQMGIPVKLTISELKKAEQELDTDAGSLIPEETEPVVPRFISRQEPVTGAARGTLYHRVLKGLPLHEVRTGEEVSRYIRSRIEAGRLPRQAAGLVRAEDIAAFLATDLARRMREADRSGRLYREQPFVLGLSAAECGYETGDPGQQLMIQGIIDVYFEEEDGLVLLDYKTDYIPKDKEEILRERYGTQLALYEKALRQLTRRPVKECFLYSFALRKLISMRQSGAQKPLA